jgi:hypothetical protein
VRVDDWASPSCRFLGRVACYKGLPDVADACNTIWTYVLRAKGGREMERRRPREGRPMTMIVFCEHRRAEGSEAWACQMCGQLCNRTSSWESCLALESTSFDRAARAVNKCGITLDPVPNPTQPHHTSRTGDSFFVLRTRPEKSPNVSRLLNSSKVLLTPSYRPSVQLPPPSLQPPWVQLARRG